MSKEIVFGQELIRICPTDDNKLEYSTNNGKIWNTRYSGSSYGDFYDLVAFGNELFAVTSKGVYVSTNNGKIWNSRYTGTSYGTFESIQVNGAELVAYTSKGVYVSKNEGRIWTKRN